MSILSSFGILSRLGFWLSSDREQPELNALELATSTDVLVFGVNQLFSVIVYERSVPFAIGDMDLISRLALPIK